MSNHIRVPDEATHILIQQAYEAGGQYQWVREGWMNSVQAFAKNIDFGICKELFERTGVLKRYIADDGIGMNDEDIKTFMQSFGGGGKPIGRNENFGQGFKSSTLPWNKYGVVIASWTKDDPEGSMVWIRYSEDERAYIFHEFLTEDENGDPENAGPVIVPEALEELQFDIRKLRTEASIAAGQGTVFVMLGNTVDEDTDCGDANKNETTLRGIVSYLNTRIYEPPAGVSTRIYAAEAGSAGARGDGVRVTHEPTGQSYTIQARRVYGVKASIPEAQASGEVVVDEHGTKVAWVLTREPGILTDSSYSISKPAVWVEHSTTYGGVSVAELYHVDTNVRAFQGFGMMRLAKRLWLSVVPPTYDGGPTWGVQPQASRNALIAKGGNPLPMGDWGDTFYANMPAELRDALAAEDGEREVGADLDRRIKERLGRFSARFRPRHFVTHKDGDVEFPETKDGTGKSRPGVPRAKPKTPSVPRPATPGGITGPTPLLDENAEGAVARGRLSNRGDELPTIHWVDSRDVWKDDKGRKMADVAYYDPLEHAIYVNWNHYVFVNELPYWYQEWPKVSESDIIEVVRGAYAAELASKVMHLASMSGRSTHPNEDEMFSRELLKDTLNEGGLLAVVVGLQNVDQYIRTTAGGRFGRAKVAA